MPTLSLVGGARTLPVWAVLALQAFEHLRHHQRVAPPVCVHPEPPAQSWEAARDLAECRSELAVALTCPVPSDPAEDEKSDWLQGAQIPVLAAFGSLCGSLLSWILCKIVACCCRDVEEAGRQEARHEGPLLEDYEVSPTHRSRARGKGVVR